MYKSVDSMSDVNETVKFPDEFLNSTQMPEKPYIV